MASWRHIRATILLPGIVLIVIPSVILFLTEHEKGVADWSRLPRVLLALGGLALIALGLMLLVNSARLFPRAGGGTIAPWEASRRLLVLGPYRYVRNPMIIGVCLVLFGEAIAAHSWALLAWAGVFLVANVFYIPVSEERGLKERFGEDYLEYKRNVPRWFPRRTPWTPGGP